METGSLLAAEALSNVTFVGRLATYKYYNMDQVVGQALAAFRRLRRRHANPSTSSSLVVSGETVLSRLDC